MQCLLYLTLLLSLLFTSVQSYASWLKCYIDLDQEEIVMHHPMRPPHEAEHQVFIEVQPYGESTWTVAEEYTLPVANKGTTDDDASVTLKVRLKVPPALELEEVQFVVEIHGDDSIKNNAAAFVDLGVMCDGSRAFSRAHDEHVVLRVNATTDGHSSNITLLAGWAHEYGAVSLTPTMAIIRGAVDGTSGDEL